MTVVLVIITLLPVLALAQVLVLVLALVLVLVLMIHLAQPHVACGRVLMSEVGKRLESESQVASGEEREECRARERRKGVREAG